MKQMLMTVLLLICIFVIYITAFDKDGTIKDSQQRFDEQTYSYVRGINA